MSLQSSSCSTDSAETRVPVEIQHGLGARAAWVLGKLAGGENASRWCSRTCTSWDREVWRSKMTPWDVPSATPALLEGFPFPWPCFQLGCDYFLAKFQSQELPCRAIGTVQPHSRALRLVWKSLEVCFYNFVFVSVFLLVVLIDWFALLCLFRIMKNKLCLQNCCLKRLRLQMKRFAGLLVTRICPSGGLFPVLASLWSQIFLFVLLRTSGALVFW